jgi:hypothetical protein
MPRGPFRPPPPRPLTKEEKKEIEMNKVHNDIQGENTSSDLLLELETKYDMCKRLALWNRLRLVPDGKDWIDVRKNLCSPIDREVMDTIKRIPGYFKGIKIIPLHGVTREFYLDNNKPIVPQLELFNKELKRAVIRGSIVHFFKATSTIDEVNFYNLI